MTTLYFLHLAAAMVIALQSIDRIFHCPLRAKGLCVKSRFSMAMKGCAWMLMAAAALGALAGPLFRGEKLVGLPSLLINPLPSVAEILLFIGFAILIVRSWVNEVIFSKKAAAQAAADAQKNPVNTPVQGGLSA